MFDTGGEVARVAGSLDSQVMTCHQLVSETLVATQCFVAMHIALFSTCQQQLHLPLLLTTTTTTIIQFGEVPF